MGRATRHVWKSEFSTGKLRLRSLNRGGVFKTVSVHMRITSWCNDNKNPKVYSLWWHHTQVSSLQGDFPTEVNGSVISWRYEHPSKTLWYALGAKTMRIMGWNLQNWPEKSLTVASNSVSYIFTLQNIDSHLPRGTKFELPHLIGVIGWDKMIFLCANEVSSSLTGLAQRVSACIMKTRIPFSW